MNDKPVSAATVLDRWLDERGMSQRLLAGELGISEQYLSDILHERRRISIRVALALEEVTPVAARDWLDYQMAYELHRGRAIGGTA